MNFAQARTIIGQKNERNYPQTVPMYGVIHEFKGEGVNPNTSKPYKKVSIKDEAGELHNVTLRGTLPDASLVNQRLQFDIYAYAGTHDSQPYTGYAGLWNNNQQARPATPTQQPAPVQQAAPVQQPTKPKADDKNNSFAASYAKDVVVQLIATGGYELNDGGKDTIKKDLKDFNDFFLATMNGQKQSYSGSPTDFNEPEFQEDEIPY